MMIPIEDVYYKNETDTVFDVGMLHPAGLIHDWTWLDWEHQENLEFPVLYPGRGH